MKQRIFKQDTPKYLYMRVVSTALNEDQYKTLQKQLDKLGVTEYELLKNLILEFIQTGTIDKVKLEYLINKIGKEVAKDLAETKNNLL